MGEFAFQVKFDRRENVADKQKQLAAQFDVSLQQDVQDWLALGVTKTAMVYRLKGTLPRAMSSAAPNVVQTRARSAQAKVSMGQGSLSREEGAIRRTEIAALA